MIFKLKILLLAELLIISLVCGGQNLVRNDLEAWKGAKKSELAPPRPGMKSFEINGPIFNSKLIPVDKSKKYLISGWLKNTGNHLQYIYFSLMPLDSEGKQIKTQEFQAYPLPGNETVLTAPCTAEDTVLKIKNGAKWKEYQYGCIAFDVDDSGKCKDIPNRNLSSIGIESIENKGEYWEVRLKSACGKNFPAGTKVREHAASSTYIYPVVIKDLNKDDGWQKFTSEIQGMTKAIIVEKMFWPGTAFIRIGVHICSPGNLIISDIRFEEKIPQ